jgi:uncharacterized protein YraI
LEDVMRNRLFAAGLAAAGLLAAPGIAAAANAVLSTPVPVRAGPGVQYPGIVQAPRGAVVDVHGCLTHWTWCDVTVAGTRGWVLGNRVQFFRNGRYVVLPSYAPVFGVPVVTFSFGDYWNRWYVGRPWYYDNGYWGRWGGGHRAPSAPAGWRPWHPGWDRSGFYPGRPGVRPGRPDARPGHPGRPGVRPGHPGRPDARTGHASRPGARPAPSRPSHGARPAHGGHASSGRTGAHGDRHGGDRDDHRR